LKQLPQALIVSHLQYVLAQEHISYEPAALNLVARAAQGSMRDALSLTDQAIAFSSGMLEESAMRSMLGAIDQGYLFELLQALHEQNGTSLLAIADNMATRSFAFDAALQDLASLLHRIALAQTVPQAIADDEPERDRLLQLAAAFTPEEVQLFYQISIHGRAEIGLAPDEYAGFTMTMLRMLAFAPERNVRSTTSTQAAIRQSPVNLAPQMAAPAFQPVIQNVSQTVPVPVAHMVAPIVQSVAAPAKAHASGDNPDWSQMLGCLSLQGMAQQLAKHCVLDDVAEQHVVLRLALEHKHLQTKMAIDNLQAALNDYFGKAMKLNIVLGEVEVATPAKIEHHTREVKQLRAGESIAQDAFVIAAQSELAASLLSDSIKPV
jgi:DNA polymerase-3 subunit gamma/tau